MENKSIKPALPVGRYFKYAIGEIGLVVIGILIALQVNNWNNNRIANKNMNSFLLNLKSDLEMDVQGINEDIDRFESATKIKRELASLTDYSEISTDSLLNIIIPVGSIYTPSRITFQKITNQGINKISNNDSLSNKIYSYYLETLAYYLNVKDYDEQSTAGDENYWMKIQNEFEINLENNYPLLKDKKMNRLGLINIISEPRGRNIITLSIFRKEAILTELEYIKSKASELILQIDEELKKQ